MASDLDKFLLVPKYDTENRLEPEPKFIAQGRKGVEHWMVENGTPHTSRSPERGRSPAGRGKEDVDREKEGRDRKDERHRDEERRDRARDEHRRDDRDRKGRDDRDKDRDRDRDRDRLDSS